MACLARIAVGVGVLAFGLSSATLVTAGTARQEAEYLALEAGLFDRQTLRPTDDTVQAIQSVLQKIRDRYPAMSGIRAGFSPQTMVMLRFQNSVTDPFCPPRRAPGPARPAALSVPAVDGITSQFAGSYRVQCSSVGFTLVLVDFPALLHVPSLLALYRRSGAVISADENMLLGGGDSVGVRKKGAAWEAVFVHGWGDCVAGCINREEFLFRVEPDGTVTKTGERRR